MKYFNIKRYKFSTIITGLINLLDRILDFLKFINIKKIFKYLKDKIQVLVKIFKYIHVPKYDVLNVIKLKLLGIIKKIEIRSNRFLFLSSSSCCYFFWVLIYINSYIF